LLSPESLQVYNSATTLNLREADLPILARILCFALVLSQFAWSQTPPSQPSPTPKPNVVEVPKAGSGDGLQILSDTRGVDFGPYLLKMKQAVQQRWYSLMPQSAQPPEMKSGKTVVSFAVLRDGTIAALKLEQSSGDKTLDRAVYGAVAYSSPLPSLPISFAGDYVLMRASFLYNPAKELTKKDSAEHKDEKGNQEPEKPKSDSPKAPPRP
jgi:TonB family protein